MKLKLLLLCFAMLFSVVRAEKNWEPINKPVVFLTAVEYQLGFKSSMPGDSLQKLTLYFNNEKVQELDLSADEKQPSLWNLPVRTFGSSGTYRLVNTAQNVDLEFRVIPGWLSLLPPLAAIILALVSRQVLIALFAGIWLGAVFIYDYNPLLSFLYALTEYIGRAPADPERTAILIFSLTLGGMVGVISKSGGTQGIVSKLSQFASNARRGQLVTWVMGILIFFDDYANTLIVGNTMRPLTDKLRISREKLSYLVDSTAAPVANIAIISTWIGYELSLINDSFNVLGIHQNAYITFFKTIPYNFYPLFALCFGFFIAFWQRDFFSMHKAEQRSARAGKVLREGATPLADVNSSELSAKEGVPLRWYNALIPVGTVIVTTLAGLWYTGLNATVQNETNLTELGTIHYISTIIGNSDSFAVLMWAAFVGSFVAILLAIGQRILNVNEALQAWVSGVKAMVMAALILTLAWAIGNICTDIQTADYVISLTRGLLSPHLLPLLSFLIAGVIAFATGTSWGTMAILTPIVIPLAYQLPASDPSINAEIQNAIFLSSIASILAGATFGDHCSPISDTTIMSSMASGADHIDHVRTQLPYALIVAAVSIIFGYLPVGYGIHDWITLLAGMVFIVLLIRFGGKQVIGRE